MSGWSHPNAVRTQRSQARKEAFLSAMVDARSIKGAARTAGVSVRTATRYLTEAR